MKLYIRKNTTRCVMLWMERSLTLFALLIVCYCFCSWAEAYQFQKLESKNLDAILAGVSGSKLSPLPAKRHVWRLEINRLGISVMVSEGVGKRELRRGAGHIPGTSLPGEPGNTAISAHRDSFFRPLRNIERNDLIRLTTSEGEFKYQVSLTKFVLPTDVSVLKSSEGEILTLITCYPFYFVGPAPKRFIVQAKRVF